MSADSQQRDITTHLVQQNGAACVGVCKHTVLFSKPSL